MFNKIRKSFRSSRHDTSPYRPIFPRKKIPPSLAVLIATHCPSPKSYRTVRTEQAKGLTSDANGATASEAISAQNELTLIINAITADVIYPLCIAIEFSTRNRSTCSRIKLGAKDESEHSVTGTTSRRQMGTGQIVIGNPHSTNKYTETNAESRSSGICLTETL